jgi:hypothetical protein
LLQRNFRLSNLIHVLQEPSLQPVGRHALAKSGLGFVTSRSPPNARYAITSFLNSRLTFLQPHVGGYLTRSRRMLSTSTATPRQQIPPNGEHLPAHSRSEPINLPCILLHLSRVQHALQPTRFHGELEQSLPLIFRQGCLLAGCSRHVLRFSLLLPRCDLCLFSS